ncbi:MAG: MazG nucleotide pyrophosphohydrolase domain-containing protein [Parcubacteria group bacterium]
METKEFQKKCAEVVNKIDKKYGIDRDPQLAFTQLVEEIGELAKDVNLKRLRKQEPDKENLSGEFADVFLQLAMLAEMHGVNLEEAVENKINKLKERGYLG